MEYKAGYTGIRKPWEARGQGMTTHNKLKKGTRVLLSHIHCPWPRFGIVQDNEEGTERSVDIVAYDYKLPEGESYDGVEVFAIFDRARGFWRAYAEVARDGGVLAKGTELLCKHSARVFPYFALLAQDYEAGTGGKAIAMDLLAIPSPYVGGEGGPTHVGEMFACFNDFTKGKPGWEFLEIRRDHATHWAQVVGTFNHTVNYFPKE